MRRHPTRARVDANDPRAWGTDDRSGFVGNHENMHWQYEWRGAKLQKLNILVYEDQLDKPQRQLGTIILPPDPKPVLNARVEQYAIDELWPMMVEASNEHGAIPLYLEDSSQPTDEAQITLSLETSTEE